MHVQCFTVIFEAFWKCVWIWEQPNDGMGDTTFAFFLLEDNPRDWASSYLCSIPTYSISLSLKWANLSCSGAGRGYKQRMWNVSLWFLRLSSSVEMNLTTWQWWDVGIKLLGLLLMVDLLFLWQVFVGIVRVYTVAFAFLVTIAETEWEPIFKFWRVCVTAESYFSWPFVWW